MGLPSMPSDNPLSRLSVQVGDLWKAVNEMRSSMGVFENATIGKGGLDIVGAGGVRVGAGGAIDVNDGGGININDGGVQVIYDQETGGRMRLGRGSIRIWDNFNTNPDGYGRIYCDPGSGFNVFRYFPPYTSGTGLENSFTIQGRTPTDAGNIWFYTDGNFNVFATERVYVDAGDGIDLLTGGDLRIYELPTTGSAANIRLDPGTAQIQYVTSSRRYKTDIADAEVDPGEVLQLRGRTWVDKGTIDRLGEQDEPVDVPRNIGFIAEELDELPSLRQFVDYDEQGRPDAIQYDRVVVGLLEVAKSQQNQIDALTRRLDALEGSTT